MSRAIHASTVTPNRPLRILHLALQGCVRAHDVEYGVTPDTGGHIRYLLDLVRALDTRPEVASQTVAVRRFSDPALSSEYAEPAGPLSTKSSIVRLAGRETGYLSKEELHRELPTLRRSLIAHLEALPRLPDLIHAHYADAGWLAAEIRERFGIPFFFTGHSLGRAKPGTEAGATLDLRIRYEERAMRDAARVIASSRDEALSQYGLYRASRHARIEVISPGCDLAEFYPPDPEPPRRDTRQPVFAHTAKLVDPSRPLVLALARPVRRKNLVGLVRAFAEHPTLRERANLAIYTGGSHAAVTDESTRRERAAIARAVETGGLAGVAAAPLLHASGEVPQLYRAAALSGGVFVNVAHDEPFGLTLLEAAACGLPVVATHHGGPVDIVSTCRNGVLVDPHDSLAIGHAIAGLIDDPIAWSSAASNGLHRLERFSWRRHAARYVAEARAVTRPTSNRAPRPRVSFDAATTVAGPYR